MNAMKKFVALVISLAMALSLLSVCSFADNEETNAADTAAVVETENSVTASDALIAKYQQLIAEGKTKYVSFGDSICAGYNPQTDKGKVFGLVSTPDTYPYMVGQALGLEHINFAYVGFRTNEVLWELGEEVNIDSYDTNYGYATWMLEDGICPIWENGLDKTVKYNKYSWNYKVEAGKKNVEEAALISLEIGNNDAFTAPLSFATADIKDTATAKYDKYQAQIDEALANNNINESLSQILSIMNKIDYYDDYIAALLYEMNKGLMTFEKNFAVIVSDLREANPDADFMVVGMYNPYRNLSLMGNGLLKVGKAGDIVTGAMNCYMKALASKYNYTYVDVTDTETWEDMGDTSISSMFSADPHPTDAGHIYMAQQIIDAIPADDAEDGCCISGISGTGLIASSVSPLSSLS